MSIFRAQLEYDPLPALRSYRGPVLSVIMHMDRPEEFNRILDGFLGRAESAV